MTEPPAPSPHPLAGAATSLRETAKWVVGGIIATAAGVFAGSSLTNLGSLDPSEDANRLWIAIGGAVIGFGALAWIARRAIAVLTVESATLRMLVTAESSNKRADKALSEVANEICEKHRSSFPPGTTTLAEFDAKVEAARHEDPRSDASHKLLEDARRFDALIMPHAGFLYVRRKFERLRKILMPMMAFAVLGFGLFAWAANPPSNRSPATEITIIDKGPPPPRM